VVAAAVPSAGTAVVPRSGVWRERLVALSRQQTPATTPRPNHDDVTLLWF